MKLLKSLKILMLLFALIFISSCDDGVVGNWDPMKWEYKNVSDGIKIIKPGGKEKDHAKYGAEIEVTKSGSVDVVCKNYKTFWFEEYPNMDYEEEFRYLFSSEYCEMKIDGNILHCEFFNVESHQPQEFQIVVTAGDIFFHFNININ